MRLGVFALSWDWVYLIDQVLYSLKPSTPRGGHSNMHHSHSCNQASWRCILRRGGVTSLFSRVKRKIVHVHVVNGHWLISSTLERWGTLLQQRMVNIAFRHSAQSILLSVSTVLRQQNWWSKFLDPSLSCNYSAYMGASTPWTPNPNCGWSSIQFHITSAFSALVAFWSTELPCAVHLQPETA